MTNEISPLSGRYKDKIGFLSKYFSEFALIKKRCFTELIYAKSLIAKKIFKSSNSDYKKIIRLINNLSDSDCEKVKKIELDTRHDVKAVEIFLKKKLNLKNPHIVHFGLTSEDINNLAYNLMLKEYLTVEQIPLIEKIISLLSELSKKYGRFPFPARTHGQLATPTTMGKEFAVYVYRLKKQIKKLKEFNFYGKLNGATGNYSALNFAFPKVNWIKFSKDLIEKELNLETSLLTTQIESHDDLCEYFNIVRQINNIILGLNLDMWLYISYGYFKKEIKSKKEVGSSTMPHKVNPINFENSEGNLTIANSLLIAHSEKLPRSRMQRDLSDSTVLRNIGVALAHSHLAILETVNGFKDLIFNEEKALSEIKDSFELLSEPVQTLLKTLNPKNDPYDLMKQLSRGSSLKKKEFEDFIKSLKIPTKIKERILKLKPETYLGLALDLIKYA